MALDYEELYTEEAGRKHVVFCLYRDPDSRVQTGQNNLPLEMLQKQLESEKEYGVHVEKAFVFGNKKVSGKSFEDTDQNGIYYQGYQTHKAPLSHLVLIALEMLYEKHKQDQSAQNELYLILNDTCERTENNKICKILEQYEKKFSFVPVLVRNKFDKELYGFEKYIAEHGKIFCHLDFLKVRVKEE